MPAIMTTSIKVIIVEERDLLREKIAGILSREEGITMVMQVSSYSKLHAVLGETVTDVVIGDFFQFIKFCKEKDILSNELCSGEKLLLYSDEDVRLSLFEAGHPGGKRIFNVLDILKEVRNFLNGAAERKKSIRLKIGAYKN